MKKASDNPVRSGLGREDTTGASSPESTLMARPQRFTNSSRRERPLPARPVPPISKGVHSSQPAQRLYGSPNPLLHGVLSGEPGPAPKTEAELSFGGAAVGDLNGDGLLDLILTSQGPDGAGRLVLLLGLPQGGLTNATTGSGLEQVIGATACALGDFDNDGILDLFVTGDKGSALWRGRGMSRVY